jgi:hypothetical protein
MMGYVPEIMTSLLGLLKGFFKFGMRLHVLLLVYGIDCEVRGWSMVFQNKFCGTLCGCLLLNLPVSFPKSSMALGLLWSEPHFQSVFWVFSVFSFHSIPGLFLGVVRVSNKGVGHGQFYHPFPSNAIGIKRGFVAYFLTSC